MNTAFPAPDFAVVPDFFRQMVEQSAQSLGVTDCEGRIQYVNPAFCRMTGAIAADLLGMPMSAVLCPLRADDVHQAMLTCLQTGELWSACLQARRLDGVAYDLRLSINRMSEQGGGCFWQAQVLVLEQAVPDSQARPLFGGVLDLVPCAAVLLDENEALLQANQDYRKLQDVLQSGNPAGLLLARLYGESDELRGQLARGDLVRCTLKLDGPHAEADRYFVLSGRWLVGEGVSPVLLLMIMDCTELQQRRQMAMLQSLHNQLAEVELAARLREALSAARFLFSRPLNMLAALERCMVLPGPEGDLMRDALAKVRQCGEDALVTLRASVPQQGDEPRTAVNCNAVMHDLLKLRTPRLLAEGVLVDWLPALRLPVVKAQSLALHVALGQLIDNALDAMRAARGVRSLRLASRDAGEWLELEICDNGPGFGGATSSKMFEPFQTTHLSGRQMGLGLVLAQEVILRQQGMLEIDRDYLAGCRVIVRLPVLAQGAR